MTTINMPILGTYTEVEGQVFSNPNMVSIEYVIVHDSDGIPPESLKGSFIGHREQEDLREYINPGVKFYFRMENKRPSIITVMKDIPDANLTQGSSSDKELIVTTYSVKTAFVGASVGDTVTQTQVIDVSSSNPTTAGVIWRNQTTNTDLLSTPLASNLSLLGVGSSLTNTQLRSAPLDVNLTNNQVEITNDIGNTIPTKIAGLIYPTSIVNSSTTQLAAGESFIGTPETVMELQAAQIQIVCDQPYRVEIFQYIDEAGTKETSVDTFTRLGNVHMNENVTLPGNYFKLKVTNLGTVATTTFEVNTTFGIMNTQPRTLTNEGNFPVAVKEGIVVVKGANDKWRDSFEKDDTTLWTKSLDSGDFYSLQGNVQGAGWGQLSKSALTSNTVSKILSTNTFTMPTRIGYGMSLSQRLSGELYSVDIVSVDPISGAELVHSGESSDSITDSFAVPQLSVSSNVATIYTSTNHTFNYDDIVVISGAVDTRVNVLARISAVINKRCVQIQLTIANATYNVGSKAIISKVNMSNGNPNIAGIAYYDTTSTNAVYYHRAQGSAPFVSVASWFTSSYTDALVPSAQPFAYNMQARANSEIIAAMDVLRFGVAITDSNGLGTFFKRTQGIPSVDATYALRLKATTLPNKAVPIEIVSATKTGSATATVVTSVAHGLGTGAYVRLYGANNQTNWANVISESVITKVSETSFTVTWGTSTTGTIYGGYVIPVNGTGSVTGAVNVGILGTTWDDGRLFVGTTATPSLNVGDTVRLVGLKDTTGAVRANTSGRFKVAAITPNVMDTAIQTGANTTASSATVTIADTNALVFGSIVNGTGITAGTKVAGITSGASLTLSAAATSTGSTWLTMTGVVLEPLDFVAPANDQPLLAISSGGIIKETDMRINFVRCLDYTRTPVEVTGGHTTNDSQLAVPVTVVGGSTGVYQGSPAAISATTGLGGWYMHPAIVGLPDIPSAAITTTATSSIIANNLGNGFQVSIAVIAVSGTNSTMDVRIEESFDGGTNWVTLYEMQRITAIGSYNTPILRATGRHIRYVRTIGGTSPSFTNAVTRNVLPFIPAEPQKRLMDRSIVLTTLNSVTPILFSGAANNVQLVINLGTATTPPALQLEGSEDGVNWYAMGAPLTGVASSTVQLTVSGLSATFVRARVSTAGATVVAGYVSIKAWS